jgi:pimeloyl-ACP methyl ester carboxylesterase
MITTSKIGKINIYQKGNAGKPPVIFLHGNSLSGMSFEKQFEAIDDIPLIAIDLPGHGLSDAALSPEDTYSLPGYVRSVKNVIDELKLTGYILAGHSLGGHIVMECAPELTGLKGIIIVGAPPLGMPPALDQAFFPNPVVGLLFKDELSEEEVNMMAASFVFDNSKVIEDFKKQIRQTDKRARVFFGGSIGKGQMQDEISIVSNLTVPIAIVHGEKDPLINSGYINGLAIPMLWKNKINIVFGSGHSPQAEKSAVFNSVLSEFYRSIFP